MDENDVMFWLNIYQICFSEHSKLKKCNFFKVYVKYISKSCFSPRCSIVIVSITLSDWYTFKTSILRDIMTKASLTLAPWTATIPLTGHMLSGHLALRSNGWGWSRQCSPIKIYLYLQLYLVVWPFSFFPIATNQGWGQKHASYKTHAAMPAHYKWMLMKCHCSAQCTGRWLTSCVYISLKLVSEA